MIVREKTPHYVAFTWQEFLAGIDALSYLLPYEAEFWGRKCVLNDTRTGYFIYDKDTDSCSCYIMNEDSIMIFYGCNNEFTATLDATTFWNKYEQVIWH